MTKAQKHIGRMSPYAIAELTARASTQVLSLSQNESLRPPSPAALLAGQSAMEGAALYPDPDWTALRAALGQMHDTDPKGIVCGNGSLELIAALAQVFGGPGRAILAPLHAYPFFRTATLLSGARFDTAPENGLTVSVDYLLKAVRADTSVVFVANPGNPTGTRLPNGEIHRLRAELRRDVLLVIDEAYSEFSDPLGERSWPLVEGGNCVVLRTFSKAYGLAGLRIGWGLFPAGIASEMRKALSPNSVNCVAQAAGLAALEDQAYMRETCQITENAREKWSAELQERGFDVQPSITNFVLIRMADARQAADADRFLRTQGVFLRGQAGAGLPGYLRMTIAPDAIMAQAVSHLTRWKEETQP